MSKSLYQTIKGNVPPTTATVGVVGNHYLDTNLGKFYVCTYVDTTNGTYTWEELSGGGTSIYDADGNALIQSTNEGLKVFTSKDASNNYGSTASLGGNTNQFAASLDSTSALYGYAHVDSAASKQIMDKTETDFSDDNMQYTKTIAVEKSGNYGHKTVEILPGSVGLTLMSNENDVTNYILLLASSTSGNEGATVGCQSSAGSILLSLNQERGAALQVDRTDKKLPVYFVDGTSKNIAFEDSTKQSIKKVNYDNTNLGDHLTEILGYINGENGGSLIEFGFKVGTTAITGTRKTVTTDTTTNTISTSTATETIVGAGNYVNCVLGGVIPGSTSGKRATFLCANDMETCSQANIDISNVNGDTKVLLSGFETGFIGENIINIYFNQIDISAITLEHLSITYHE